MRQHLILDDSALLDDYDRDAPEFRTTATPARVAAARRRASWRRSTQLTDSESRLHKLLAMPQRSADTQTQLAGRLRASRRSARRRCSPRSNAADASARSSGCRKSRRRAGRSGCYLALATAAIALALAILFAVLIARPIRQLDQAIRQMGTADFTHAIEVNGPQDLRYLGQRLEWLRSRLSDLEEQQNRFLRHVSHELKTPLTAVREGAELLRDNVGGKLSPEQREIVRIVRENTLSLQKLIEDLLTYHQTRAMEPQTLGPVSLPDVVQRVVERAQARRACADDHVRRDSSSPRIVVGDADKVRTIVDNLVSNAIKYSPRSASIAGDARHGAGFAVLDVVDRGPGVDPDERAAHLRLVLPGHGRPPKAASRARASGSRSRASTRWRTADESRCSIAPIGDAGARFRLWLPLAAAADAGVAMRGRQAAPRDQDGGGG